ncbi:unnamed protein product [Rotaria sp. Silwood1]|nr:unnamed protein product [Rotaria sp. Silwood1]
MSSQGECLSQRTAFHTAGSHKPIEVKQQSLARVAQIMGTVSEDNENTNENKNNDLSENENEFDGDEVDDDLVFSTVPQRSTIATTSKIHFDEIDDDEMRRFAESFEQEQQDTKMDDNDQLGDDDDDQLCQDYARKMQTPTKSIQIENNKRKEPCIEDLDALLNDNDNDEYNIENRMEQQQQMSPVFKKKP